MDAMQALRELTEISSQIEAACLFDASGPQAASTLTDEAASARFVDAARALLGAAGAIPHDAGSGPLAQLDAATLEGSVFVVLDGDLAAAAATGPEPTAGLVFYDLKSCLRAARTPGDDDGKPRPKARKRETSPSESAA
jgi:predicted regulator of Ras-like GTPase activity (Roadblock/LC7/MglB family)